MEPKDTIELINHIVNSSGGNKWYGYYDRDLDYDNKDKDRTVILTEEESDDFDTYLDDVEKYRKETRLLAQRKKEANTAKKKLADKVKKLESTIVSLKELIEKYGDLKDSASLLTAALLELDGQLPPAQGRRLEPRLKESGSYG